MRSVRVLNSLDNFKKKTKKIGHIDYIDCHTLFYDEPVGHVLDVRKTTSLSPDPRLLDIPEVCFGKQTKIDAILVLDTRGGFILSFCDKCKKDFKNNVGKP